MQQPNVSFVCGNHNMAWLGAALGHEALICQVLRITLRYRRLLQLEEGYGVPIEPLETLVRKVYTDDPATGFEVKGSGMRDPVTVARMQKAAAVMQFKLEGQAIERHPEWQMDHRRLLHRDYNDHAGPFIPCYLIIDDIVHDKVSSPGQPSAEFTRPKSECSRARRS
jgi:fructose-1,6-bisphosphatase III